MNFWWSEVNKELKFRTGNGSTSVMANTTGVDWTAGAWVHFAVLVDKTANTCELFVNGIDKSSVKTIFSNFNTTNNFILGKSNPEQAWAYLDDIHIYNRKLTQSQISTVMTTFNSPVFDSSPSIPEGFTAQFNGNIGGIQWKSTGGSDPQATHQKEYDFHYDGLNRLNAAQYVNLTNTAYKGTYNEDNITYDLNGNINSLRRTGGLDANSSLKVIDNLAYSYANNKNSNKLIGIADIGDKTIGFIDGNITGDAYLYDENGNMTADNNKGITIEYNLLNLPSKIWRGTDYIEYTYDAAGTKLSKKAYIGGATTTTDYCGETEYRNGTLTYLHTEEGLVEYNTSSFTYKYFLKDHLGNTRAVVSLGTSNALVVEQVSSYYPFGMAHNPIFNNGNTSNKYLYNGKELQDENLDGAQLGLYDFNYRFYDPQIARFVSVDPKAEKKNWQSAYIYCSNNPLNRIDPDGMDDYTIDRKGVITFKNKAEGNDRLISLGKNGKIDYDKKGNITDKTITLDQKILRSHSEGSSGGNKFDQYVGTDGMATSLFKFAAKNTNVEWGLTKYTSPNGINASALTTGHENHFEPGSSFIQNSLISNKWEFREHIHNHPGGSHAPSGEIGGKDMGDRAFAKRYETYYPNSTFKIYTAQDDYSQTYNSNTPVITQELEEIVVTPKK